MISIQNMGSKAMVQSIPTALPFSDILVNFYLKELCFAFSFPIILSPGWFLKRVSYITGTLLAQQVFFSPSLLASVLFQTIPPETSGIAFEEISRTKRKIALLPLSTDCTGSLGGKKTPLYSSFLLVDGS